MSANVKRSLKYIVGAQKFDPTCRRTLVKKLPQDIRALEALLKVFA